MADRTQLYDALKSADAAGDHASAQKLADYIRTLDEPQAAAQKPVSQELGLEEGLVNVFDRGTRGLYEFVDRAPAAAVTGGASLMTGSGRLPIAEGVDEVGKSLGLATTGEAISAHHRYFQNREKTERPGGLGRFAGEVIGTVPLAIENPWLAGGAMGMAAGEGETPQGLAGDAALGAVGGKVGHEVVGAAARHLAPAFRSATGRASDYIARIMDSAGKTAADLESAARNKFGKPITGAEAIGRTGKTALTALGRREGVTPDKSEALFANRRQERAGRMLQDVVEATGVSSEAAQGKLDTVVSDGKKAAKPLYDLAFEAQPQTSKYLERLAREPIIQLGMRHGIKIERLAALAENRPFDPHAYAIVGYQPTEKAVSQELPFTPSVGSFERTNVEPIIGQRPTWKTWDAAKTGLDHIIETHRNPMTGKVNWTKELHEVDNVRRAMLDEVDRLNPAYKAARAKAGDYLSAREAFHEGTQALFNGRVTEQQFSDRVDKMSSTELESLKGGIANQLFNFAQTGKMTPKILVTPRIQSKLTKAFGRDAAQQLIERFKVEGEMLQSENRIPPGFGSVTSEVLNATDEQNVAADVIKELGHAAVYYAGGMHHAGTFRLANTVQKLAAWARTKDLPPEVRNEIGSMLLMSPDELARHVRARPQIIRDITKMVARVQTELQRVPAVAAVQAGP